MDITGGWNGDFYAQLVHDTGFAVLLNRIVRTGTMTVGSSSSGMLVNFDDQAELDIHRSPTAGSLSGSWQPDSYSCSGDLPCLGPDAANVPSSLS